MSQDTTSQTSPLPAPEEMRISSVSDFIEKIVQRDQEVGTESFYRGHADESWKLLPSIFRTPNGVEKEHLLFRDMVAHEPQSFSECKSALDYLVQMQHYGLPTRLLDMTTNPLVALYFACQSADDDVSAGVYAGFMSGLEVGLTADGGKPNTGTLVGALTGALAGALTGVLGDADALAAGAVSAAVVGGGLRPLGDVQNVAMASAGAGAESGAKAKAKDGVVYLFSVPDKKVKHYDSDTISILANLAKCKREELDLRLYPTRDLSSSFYDGFALQTSISGESLERYWRHEAVCIGRSFAEPPFGPVRLEAKKLNNYFLADLIVPDEPLSEDYFRSKDPFKGAEHWADEVERLIIAESPVYELESSSYLKWFNKQEGISFLLHQIKGEKPHFQRLIQAYDLVSVFFVKAKYGNQRIANQAGAFLLFGLGLNSDQDSDGCWGPLYCGKDIHPNLPEEWIKKKLIIPKECKAGILKELALLGITDSYIYPGMEQYAKELKKKYKL
jgi:FRG domain protein